MINEDCREMRKYMTHKSLEYAQIEFLWQTNMIDTHMPMKGKYPEGKYSCPHCREGRETGVVESPAHLMVCMAYADHRAGIDPELVVEDRPMYLMKAMKVRKK